MQLLKKVRDELYDKPTKAWTQLVTKLRADKIPAVSPSSAKPEGHLRFVCISDTHSQTDNLVLPPGDVLLHAGDFSKVGKPGEIQHFDEFLRRQTSFAHKIVIAGNHDLTFDVVNFDKLGPKFGLQGIDPVATKALLRNCTYLEDEMAVIEGIRIFGSPWQPWFWDWGFNVDRGEKIRLKWEKIPECDILITHGPPIGHGDLCSGGERAGCVDLLYEMQARIKPKYHVFGHIHEGYGVTTDGSTTYINSSTCDLRYKAIQEPIVFDYPMKPK